MTRHTVRPLVLVNVAERGHIDVIPVGYRPGDDTINLVDTIATAIAEGFVRDLPGCDVATLTNDTEDCPASLTYLHDVTGRVIGCRVVRGMDWCEFDDVVRYLVEGDLNVVRAEVK